MKYKRLNSSRIREKVADIKENLLILRNYAIQDKNEFLSNKEAIRSAKYAFIIMIEAACNIANHLCARLLGSSPESYAECFLILGNQNIINEALALRLAKMAGFRNLLVHGYAEVDDHKMLDIMNNNIDDVELWLQELNQVLLKNEKSDKNNDH